MKTKKTKTQNAFSENKMSSNWIDTEINTWYPINFQWIPIMKLNKSMNK
jgi:hypothetical protein